MELPTAALRFSLWFRLLLIKQSLPPNLPSPLLQVKAPPANPEVELQRTKAVETHRHFVRQGNAHTRIGQGWSSQHTHPDIMKYDEIWNNIPTPGTVCAGAGHPHPLPLFLGPRQWNCDLAKYYYSSAAKRCHVQVNLINQTHSPQHAREHPSNHPPIIQSPNHPIAQP